MNKFNPMQYLDVNTLPTALQRGLAMLQRPKETWPVVRADNAELPALLMGYALWWVLWAVLGGAVVSAVVGTVGALQQRGGYELLLSVWSVVPEFFSWFAAVVVVAWGMLQFVNAQGRVQLSRQQVLQLVVHAMTPVWLLAPLMAVPVLGGWALWVGMGWGLYCAWLGLGEITDLPPAEHSSAMAVLAGSALLAAVLFFALGWLTLVGGVIALFVMGQDKRDVEANGSEADAAHSANTVNEGPNQSAPHGAPQTMAQTAADDAAWDATAVVAADTQAPASPAYEFNLAPMTAANTAANAKKIADLDKKIAKATDQGDMALVSRLMGERGVLQQGHNPDF